MTIQPLVKRIIRSLSSGNVFISDLNLRLNPGEEIDVLKCESFNNNYYRTIHQLNESQDLDQAVRLGLVEVEDENGRILGQINERKATWTATLWDIVSYGVGNSGSSSTALSIYDEGSLIGTQFSKLDFIGSTVSATDAGSNRASITISGGGASQLTDLTDFPNSYIGYGNYGLKVNSSESGISFFDIFEPTDYGGNLTLNSLRGTGYGTIQDFVTLFGSAGLLTGGDITDNGDGTVNVSAGEGLLRETSNPTSNLYFIQWDSTNITIPINSTKFIGLSYNSGIPQVITLDSDTFCGNGSFSLGDAINENGTIHIETTEDTANNSVCKIRRRFYQTRTVERDNLNGGLILGETGTRNITVTSGSVWIKLSSKTFSSIDTSGSDTFSTYYRDGLGGFTDPTGVTQWPNTQYDDGTGTLATLGNNKYGVLWFYLETDGHLMMLYGRGEYNTAAAADAEGAPSNVPDRAGIQGILLGKLIFQKSASTATSIQSAFTRSFSSAVVSDHGNLSGLTDDDHSQYTLLLGRSGGQTLIGGTGSGDDLTLQTTSNVSKGTYFLTDLASNGFVKTSGGTGALSIDTSSYQTLDATLTALAGLSTSADQMIYSTGADAFSMTNLTSFARTLLDDADQATAQSTLGVDPAGTDNSTDVTLAGSYDYLTITGQQITRNQIDLTTDVTGTLPVGNGGTGTSTTFTQGSVIFAGASGVYSQDNANFFWNNSGKKLGLGTTDPSGILTIADSSNSYAVIQQAGNNSAGPTLNLFKSRGTIGSETLVSNNDVAGNITWAAHDGTVYDDVASIQGIVADLSAGDIDGKLSFYVATNSVLNEVLTLSKEGNLAADGSITGSNLSGTNTGDVTLAGSYDYLTISSQQISLGQIDLTTDVTGALPTANGGTGLSTIAAGSILAANTLNTLSAITSTSSLKVLQNSAGTISWAGTTGTGNVVYDTGPTLGAITVTSIAIGANTLNTSEWAYLDGQNQSIATTSSVTFANATLATGGALRTSTSAGNTLLIQAYDTDTGPAYSTFITLTAGTTPTCDLASGVTIGYAYIYRAGGATDVAVADGGTGLSTIPQFSMLYAPTANTLSSTTNLTWTESVLTVTGRVSASNVYSPAFEPVLNKTGFSASSSTVSLSEHADFTKTRFYAGGSIRANLTSAGLRVGSDTAAGTMVDVTGDIRSNGIISTTRGTGGYASRFFGSGYNLIIDNLSTNAAARIAFYTYQASTTWAETAAIDGPSGDFSLAIGTIVSGSIHSFNFYYSGTLAATQTTPYIIIPFGCTIVKARAQLLTAPGTSKDVTVAVNGATNSSATFSTNHVAAAQLTMSGTTNNVSTTTIASASLTAGYKMNCTITQTSGGSGADIAIAVIVRKTATY